VLLFHTSRTRKQGASIAAPKRPPARLIPIGAAVAGDLPLAYCLGEVESPLRKYPSPEGGRLEGSGKVNAPKGCGFSEARVLLFANEEVGEKSGAG
jgi:hypothetical protein